MINILSTIADLFVDVSDCSTLGPEFTNQLKYIYTAIKISIPILVVVLVTLDLTKAVMAGDDGEIKKAQGHAVKRIVIGLAVFFVPDILDIILITVGIATGTCGIGG